MSDDLKAADSSLGKDSWPLRPSERRWNSRALFIVLMVAASATWCYIIGEYVGYYLPLWPGFWAMTAGAMIGMLLVTLAVVPTSSRFGVDSIKSAVPQFGHNGWAITVPLQYLSIIGWNSLLIIFFGRSVSALMILLDIGDKGQQNLVVSVTTVLACLFVFFTLKRGANGLEKVAMWLFVAIVAVGAWMIIMLIVKEGSALSTALPAYASDKQLDFQYGIEIGLVSLLSWWPYIGSMTREARTPSIAAAPSMLGMGLPVPILSFVGLAAILVLETSDPAGWLADVGGPLYGAIALLFVITANLGTATAGIYASTVGIKAVPGLAKLSWNTALLVSIVPVVVIGLFFPNWVFDNFGTFVAYIGVFFAPLCGIQIVDYFFLRRQKISIRGLYTSGPDAPYSYWFGINPAAILAMAAGVATYLYLLNPVSYAIKEPFPLLGASLPAAAVAAVVFGLVTLLLVKPMGKGGYSK
ncbi:MAG: cytosine permease [Candidatus Nanopelagicaceae bacterium]